VRTSSCAPRWFGEVATQSVSCLVKRPYAPVLKSSGETVSTDGTHLGHNLPDRSGNRYCINLVCVAAQPPTAQ
jgi:peptide methionine sulfoxide reductase MsrB